MNNIEYFKLIASPLEPMLEKIKEHDTKIEFSYSEFKDNLKIFGSQKAYYFDDDGIEQEADNKTVLSSAFVNYLLTFYIAKDNITDESFKKVELMICNVCMIHKKFYEVVDADKVDEFIESFIRLISVISLRSNIESNELIQAYIRIHQDKPMFD